MKARHLPLFVSALSLAFSVSRIHAATHTWDGGAANGNWGEASNWVGDDVTVPTFDQTADVVFYQTGSQLTNYLNGERTIRSLTFNATATSAVTVRTRQVAGGAQLGRILTFDADAGNATVTVAATTANHAINGGTVAVGGTGGSIALTDSLNVVHNGALTDGTLTLGQNNNGTITDSETPITGAGGISKSGTGVLVLAGPNTFEGGVNISGGRVQVTHNNALGTGPVTLSGTDAELRLAADGIVTPAANTLTVGDTGDRKVLQGLKDPGASTFGGTITINEATAGNFELAAGGNHTFTVSGNISGSTAAGIKKSSGGTVILSGNNSYSGDTVVSNGTLKIGSATAIPSGAGKGLVSVNSGTTFGGTFDLNGNNITIGGLYGGSTTAAFKGDILNSVAGTSEMTIDEARTSPSASITFNGLIRDNAGSGGVVAIKKTNTGTTILAGANTFSGGLTISGGRVELNNNSAAGTGTITLDATDAQVQTGGGRTISNPLVISDTGDVKQLRHFNASAATYAGLITVNETSAGNFWLQAGTGAQLTITGNITGIGGINKIGAGTVILQGAKTYTGPTHVGNGIVTADTDFFADNSTVRIGKPTASATTSGTLNLTHAGTDKIGKLYVDTVSQPKGIYKAVGAAGAGTEVPFLTGTGKLEVAGETFSSWMSGYTFEPGADTSPTGDADNDGVDNLVENVLDTPPNAASNGLTQISATAGSVTFKHRLNPNIASDVSYTYQFSTDLSEWKASGVANSGGVTATISAGTPVDGVVTVTTAVTAGSAPKLFSRLVATQN